MLQQLTLLLALLPLYTIAEADVDLIMCNGEFPLIIVIGMGMESEYMAVAGSYDQKMLC